MSTSSSAASTEGCCNSSSGSESGVCQVQSPAARRPAFTSDTERPCGHNHWTKQTKKRGKLVLKCDVCECVWKTRPEAHTKCSAFHVGRCTRGGRCPHPHIYARKDVRRRPQHAGHHWRGAPQSGVKAFMLPPAAISPVEYPLQQQQQQQQHVAPPSPPLPSPLPMQSVTCCYHEERVYERRSWTHNPYGV